MDDERDSLHLQSQIHPSVFVAVATLVLAGSAVFLRNNLRSTTRSSLLPSGFGTESGTIQADENDIDDDDETKNLAGSSKVQPARSKERRKRRKDPMKELMKGGKRAKDIAKLLKHIDVPGPSDPSSSSTPNSASSFPPHSSQELSTRSANPKRTRSASRSDSGPHARDPSTSRSSRSVSISSDAPESSHGDEPSAYGDDDDEDDDIPSTAIPPSPILPPSTPSIAVSAGTPTSSSAVYLDLDSALDEDKLGLSDTLSSTPSSKLTPKNNRRNKNSNSKNSTGNIANNHISSALGPSHSMPSTSAHSMQTEASSSSTVLNAIPSSSRTDKPPRFRSELNTGQSDQSGLGFSTSMPIYSTFHASSSASKLESQSPDSESVENDAHSPLSAPFSFPTLNGAGSAPGSSRATPPGSTNSAGLSTQTQISSLRGALEASKKREEEAKGREERTRMELEKLGNEVKMLRWEGNIWRQREGELQSQVHHLVQQVQSYAAYFAPTQPMQQFPQLTVPQPQRSAARHSHSRGKRPPTQNQASPASSRSTSKSSRPSRSSHASPIPPLAQLPENQSTSQGSSPSIGSPIAAPNRIFSPTAFSPGASSTPFFSNPHGVRPFPPPAPPSFGMFSPTGPLPGGIPFANGSPLASAGITSPLSPHSPYPSYPPYSAFAPPTQDAGTGNRSASRSSGGKMHPTQFLNLLNKAHGSTENNGLSASSTLSSLASGTESTDSMSPESTSSPSPAPSSTTGERGRKRGRGETATAAGGVDRMLGYGNGYPQYAYPYGYPYPYLPPNSYQYSPGTTPAENGKEENNGTSNGEEVANGNNKIIHDSDSYSDMNDDDDGGELNELLAGAILKRPESMMGLRRSGSGSGRSSKSNFRLQISPTESSFNLGGVGAGQSGDETTLIMTPGSDSELGSALNWVKDPALFRREADDISPTSSLSALAPIPRMRSQSQSKQHSAPQSTISEPNSNEIDLDTTGSESSSSSSSSSTQSTSSESLPEAPPVEFTFPSIATWGYSYRTHSVGDLDDQPKAKTARSPAELPEAVDMIPNDYAVPEDEGEGNTPPADKTSNLIPSNPDLASSDDTLKPSLHDERPTGNDTTESTPMTESI